MTGLIKPSCFEIGEVVVNGIDSFLDGKHRLLSESDGLCSKNWRMIRVIAVVRAKHLEVTLVGWLGHYRGEKVGVYIVWMQLRL